jgi:anti-anti-sigma factor
MPREMSLHAEDPQPPDLGIQALDLTVAVEEPGRLVALSGRLSARTVSEGRAALVDAIGLADGDLVVDVSGLQLVDASGLGVLVGVHRLAIRSERRLVLRDVPERIERLLAVTHLNRVLRLEQEHPIQV